MTASDTRNRRMPAPVAFQEILEPNVLRDQPRNLPIHNIGMSNTSSTSGNQSTPALFTTTGFGRRRFGSINTTRGPKPTRRMRQNSVGAESSRMNDLNRVRQFGGSARARVSFISLGFMALPNKSTGSAHVSFGE